MSANINSATGSLILLNPSHKGIDNGWIDANEIWTYASADAPTYTFTVAADVTTKYSAGMKIKLTDSTVKYFIITAVSAYSGGNTTITVYGGTDYTLSGGAITLPYYSMQRSPVGFPMSPTKWIVETKYTSDAGQTSPTQSQWYNLGSVSISIPIGVWKVSYHSPLYVEKATPIEGKITLSTANNSESNVDYTSYIYAPARIQEMTYREWIFTTAAKVAYYLNEMTPTASATDLRIYGAVSTIFVRAECTYL